MTKGDPNLERKAAVDKYHTELLATMRNKAAEMDMTTKRGADYNSWRYKYELPKMAKGGAAYAGPKIGNKFKLPYERRAVLAAGAGVTGGAAPIIGDYDDIFGFSKTRKKLPNFGRAYIPGRKMDPVSENQKRFSETYTRSKGGKAIIQQERAKPRISSKYNVFVRLMRARLKDNPKFKTMAETAKVSYIADLWNSYKTGAMPELAAEIERAQQSEAQKINKTMTRTLKTNIKQNPLYKKTTQTATDAKNLLEMMQMRRLQTGEAGNYLTEARLRHLAGDTRATDRDLLDEIKSQYAASTSTRTNSRQSRSEGRRARFPDADDAEDAFSYMGSDYTIPIRVPPGNLRDRHIASEEMTRQMYKNTQDLDYDTDYGPVNPIISKETRDDFELYDEKHGADDADDDYYDDETVYMPDEDENEIDIKRPEKIYIPEEDENEIDIKRPEKIYIPPPPYQEEDALSLIRNQDESEMKMFNLYEALQNAKNISDKSLVMANAPEARNIVMGDPDLIDRLSRIGSIESRILYFEKYLKNKIATGQQLAILPPQETGKNKDFSKRFPNMDDNKETAIAIINGQPHLEIKLPDNYIDRRPVIENISTATGEEDISDLPPPPYSDQSEPGEMGDVEFITMRGRDRNRKMRTRYVVKYADGSMENFKTKNKFDNLRKEYMRTGQRFKNVSFDPESEQPATVSFSSRVKVRPIPAQGERKKVRGDKGKKRSATPAKKKGSGRKMRKMRK